MLIYVHSKREQKKLSPVIKFTVLPFRHYYLRVAVISNVDTSRQTTPPLVDGVVHNRLVQIAPHGDQTLAQLVDVLGVAA